jgi:putative phosphoesterase
MKKILLISDTHSYLDTRFVKHLKTVDEVWHAGDIGDIAVCDKILMSCSEVNIVYGNIDNNIVRAEYQKDLFFNCEGVNVWMTHIGGYPPRYRDNIKQVISEKNINLFICGHSHILKVMYDKEIQCLHMNPGAAGQYGIHKVQTVLKFVIDQGVIKDLSIVELDRL